MLCKICGMEIEKNDKTEKMEELFANIWCDKDGRFGLNEPYHWHEPTPKPNKKMNQMVISSVSDCEHELTDEGAVGKEAGF